MRKDRGSNFREEGKKKNYRKGQDQKKRTTAYKNTREEKREDDGMGNSLIYGRNSVLETLIALEEAEARGKKTPLTLEEIIMQEGATGSVSKITGKAKSLGVKVSIVPKEKIQRIIGAHNGEFVKHQGVIGIISPYRYNQVDEILELAQKRGEEPFIIILDGIEDPHNLGAIMRTAECAGAHGVIIPNRRSATINETVIKVSAGAVAHLMCSKVSNLVETVKYLQEKGVWITALDMDGEDYTKSNFSGPMAIVVGGEERGVSRLLKETSDFIISLPVKGKINSLNASNAAAIVIYKAEEMKRNNK